MAFWDKLTPGDSISAFFLLREYQVGVGKNGKRYLSLTLGNAEGDIEGRLWDDVEVIEPELARNIPVRVEGALSSYRDKLQVVVRTMVRMPWSDQLFSELVPSSRFSREVLEGGLRSKLQSLVNPWIRTLVDRLLASPDISQRFFEAPAAKGMHHAYIRGLCEHTLSMMQAADLLYGHYETQFPGMLSRDELLLGVFLHDIGKTVEYTYLEGIDFSLKGRLVGHLALGLMALNDAIASISGFPSDLADRLRHLILAHHGEPEKGSPVWPITPEALLLHHVDHLDAELNAVGMLALQSGGDEMTPYSNKFGRRFVNPFNRKPEEPAIPVGRLDDPTPEAVTVSATQPATEPATESDAPESQQAPAVDSATEPLPLTEPSVSVEPLPEALPEQPATSAESEAARTKPRPKKGLTGPSLF